MRWEYLSTATELLRSVRPAHVVNRAQVAGADVHRGQHRADVSRSIRMFRT
jgi:hypothetical protein